MTTLSTTLLPTTAQASPSHSAMHNVVNGIYNTFFQPTANGIVIPGSGYVVAGPFSIGRDPSLITASDFSVISTKGSTWVMADFNYVQTGTGHDSGAARFVTYSLVAGSNSVRASEHHVIRGALASSSGTWGIEIGLHSEVAGDGVNRNVGIYLSASHTGWTATGVRADTGIHIVGEDGWTHAIRYLDTDSATVLFDISQTGAVGIYCAPSGSYRLDIASPVANALMRVTATGAGIAALTMVSAGASNSLYTTAAGNVSFDADGVAAGVINFVHAAAVANSVFISAGKTGFGTATVSANTRITIAIGATAYMEFPTADGTAEGSYAGRLPVIVNGNLRYISYNNA